MKTKYKDFLYEQNGSKLILWHGSSSDKVINRFRDNSFFASDYIAQSYAFNLGGLLYKVEVDGLNPFILQEERARMKNLSSGAALSGTDPFFEELFTKLYGENELDFFHKYGLQYHTFTALVNGNYDPLIKYAKENGYDSLKFWDESFDTFVKDFAYIIFDGSKVKIVDVYEVDMNGSQFVITKIK